MEPISIKEIYRELLSVGLYRGVLGRAACGGVRRLLEAAAREDAEELHDAYGALTAELMNAGELAAGLAEELGGGLSAAVLAEALEDENAFTRLAADSRTGGAELLTDGQAACVPAARRELDILFRAAQGAAWAAQAAGLPAEVWRGARDGNGALRAEAPWGGQLESVAAWHKRRGVGPFVRHRAFLWDGTLRPVARPDPVRLDGLKEYQYQQSVAVENTRAFIRGAQANNILFYGDRGTGKSSTVKALLNEFAADGLRMIELPKEALRSLPALTARLEAVPMRFVLFIDDLSFSGGEDDFAALKAALEGGLAAKPPNVLIYATSNRRHLLRETFSDRAGDELHHADTVQESISLSDRFGIMLTYLMPDRERFFSIVRQLAEDEGVGLPDGELTAAAERWAMERGGRSPRFARQFINDLAAKRRGV